MTLFQSAQRNGNISQTTKYRKWGSISLSDDFLLVADVGIEGMRRVKKNRKDTPHASPGKILHC